MLTYEKMLDDLTAAGLRPSPPKRLRPSPPKRTVASAGSGECPLCFRALVLEYGLEPGRSASFFDVTIRVFKYLSFYCAGCGFTARYERRATPPGPAATSAPLRLYLDRCEDEPEPGRLEMLERFCTNYAAWYTVQWGSRP